MKKKLIILVVFVAMVTVGIIPVGANASSPSVPLQHIELSYTVNPIEAVCMGSSQGQLASGTDPFNLDMVDVKGLHKDGDGIYVAVLDTGLLSNYLDFFPEQMVDIKEEWGKGFTHDLIWVGSGGNWSEEFDYAPVRDDRGFLTYDWGNPDKYGYPFGSGHGTHVTSIITGWQLNRPDGYSWIPGVASKVTIIPVLVLDDWIEFDPEFNDGWWWSGGTDEMVAAGIRYIGDLANEHNIKIVVNLSLGGPTPSDEIEDAIDYAISKGVIIVASAGNDGYDGMGWPGALPQVISVGAAGWTQEYLRYYTGEPDPWYWWTDNVKENLWTKDPLNNDFHAYLTDFSSRPNPALGQQPEHLDVSAPGAGVKGPYKPEGGSDWNYYSVWGTSQAAPHVSGVAALLLQKYPNGNQFTMESCLKTAGQFNPLTKPHEGDRSATVFSIFDNDLVEFTWYSNDYGTGLLQADDAFYVAKSTF